MKKILKNNIKLLIVFIIGLVIGGSAIYVVATTYYSNNVVYNSANSSLSATNVSDALDELYRKSVGPIITSVVDNEDLTATVNITVTVNAVKSVCVNTSAKTTDDCTWKSVSGTSFTTNAVSSAGSYYIHVQDTGGRITHSSSVSLTKAVIVTYTMFDTVYLNQSITGKTTYETPDLAMAAWQTKYGVTLPFYLRHIINDNNIVTESYAVFVVTETMANTYSGMTAGTYYLKGGDSGASFVDNAKTIYDTFGSQCSSNPYTTTPTSSFSCSVSSLYVIVNSDDSIYVSDNESSGYCPLTCYVYSYSYCYQDAPC